VKRALFAAALSGAVAVTTLSGCQGCEEEKTMPKATPSAKPSAASPASARAPSKRHRPREGSGALRAQIDQARKATVPYLAPSEAELAAFGEWAGRLFAGALTDTLPEHAAPGGFVGRVADGGRVWLIAESPDKKRGAGFYVFRPGNARPLLIEAPHTFYDRGTLELGLLAFERLDARALAINTVHRSSGKTAEERAQDAESGDSPSDLSHAKRSFFSTFHGALIEAEPELAVVQIHGFRDERAQGTDVIVSASGTRGNARGVAAALREVVPGRVRLFPDEIDILGGTQNAQAAISRERKSGFVHLEISGTLRGRLKDDEALAARFVDALGLAAESTR
jgi:hypothetical protein